VVKVNNINTGNSTVFAKGVIKVFIKADFLDVVICPTVIPENKRLSIKGICLNHFLFQSRNGKKPRFLGRFQTGAWRKKNQGEESP
jgi:hypothetical protein